MKASFYKGGLIVEPETPEDIEQFQSSFPASYLKSSKIAKIRHFTNRFGEAEGTKTYLYVSGVKEATAEGTIEVDGGGVQLLNETTSQPEIPLP